jgi:hypothetical protein
VCITFIDNGGIQIMSKLLRGVAAGWGASKLGGGCFTTVLVFVLLWWLLGSFDIFKKRWALDGEST